MHPAAVTYDELGGKGTATAAAAIKAADPGAAVLGPSGWGYCEWVASGADGCAPGADAAAHGGLNLSQWYLKNMKDYSDAARRQALPRLLRPALLPADQRRQGPRRPNALRLRSTRSLWDPTYVDESWIGPSGVNAPPLQFIRTMKAWVAQYYPGTKIAITEYNWGALDDINGALAEADVLGIFGREGLDLATMWGEPQADRTGRVRVPDVPRLRRRGQPVRRRQRVGEPAATRGSWRCTRRSAPSDKALTLMVVNKTGGDLTSPLSVAGFDYAGTAQRFTYSPADLGADRARRRSRGEQWAASTATYPANSITLLVLPAAGCSASLHVNGDWNTGHVATVTVTNDRRTAVTGWRVGWTWPGDQQVTNSWNTTLTQNGATVVAKDAGWNGSIGAGGSTTFGIQATGPAASPTLTCTPT